MQILVLVALACACSMIVIVTPNIMALGAVSTLALVLISAFYSLGSHTLLGTLMSVAVFLSVFQSAFFVSCFRVIPGTNAEAEKVRIQPYA
jgi:hypothetical protein